jgi:hypothetical protein
LPNTCSFHGLISRSLFHTLFRNASSARKMEPCCNSRTEWVIISWLLANCSFSHTPQRLQACSRMQLLVVRVNCHHMQPLPCSSNLSISFVTSAPVRALTKLSTKHCNLQVATRFGGLHWARHAA